MAAPSVTPASTELVEAKYRSTTITCIIAAGSILVTLFYLVGLYLVAHRWARGDSSLNKYSSVRLQRSAPCATHPLYVVEITLTYPRQSCTYY